MLLLLALVACDLSDIDDGPDPLACECDPVETGDSSVGETGDTGDTGDTEDTGATK